MPIPKMMLAGGLTVALAAGGGAALAHELLDNPSTATGSSPTASTRPISNTSPSGIYDGAKDAVTYIVADTPEGQATGSGFVISKDGLIVTNDHVVDGATRVQVKVGTSDKAQDATVVGADPSRDLALLKVDGSNLSTLSLGDSSPVGVGDAVYAIGNPFGLDHTFTTGIVSALQREPPGARRRDDLRRHPDRRRAQPRQLGRPAARRRRAGHRRQRPDRDRLAERRRRRQCRHRLRDPVEHGEGVRPGGQGRQACAAAVQQQQPDPYGFGIG